MTPEVASLLLRQHATLMDEGRGPEGESPEDRGTLNEAWGLVSGAGFQADRFTTHWGYDFGFVGALEHNDSCSCHSARVSRNELRYCTDCYRYVEIEGGHDCPPSVAVRWLTS